MIWFVVGFAACGVVAVWCQRAAYENGVSDGWRAAKRPTDPLWIRKIKPIVEKFGEEWR